MDHRIFNVGTDVNACDCIRGCANTVTESAMKDDSRRKKTLNRTEEWNLHERCAGPTPNQLGYIPARSRSVAKAIRSK